MEPPVVATAQIGPARKRRKQAKTVAVGCVWVPDTEIRVPGGRVSGVASSYRARAVIASGLDEVRVHRAVRDAQKARHAVGYAAS
jgi:hypothetical protein